MNLIAGDCIEVMAGMEPESVDAIVTDPPYGLEFMGKEWDKPWSSQFTAIGQGRPLPDRQLHVNPRCRTCGGYERGTKKPCHCAVPDWADSQGAAVGRTNRAYGEWSQQWAEAAYRVAKPSAYLLAFGGTRTVHRMTVALEDAGWIIRDMLVWAYACLSDDTEVLTAEGWVRYHSASVGQLAASFDPDSGELRWAPIEAVHVYDHEGDMAEVGPSLVTLNHRVVLDANDRVPRVPGLRDGVLEAAGVGQEGSRARVFEGLQRQASHPGSPLPTGQDVERGAEGARVRGHDGSDELGLEGRRYRVQEAWELRRSQVRSLAGVGASDGPQGRVHHGAPADDGRGVRLPDDQDRGREPREPRSDGQPAREPDALAGQPDAQALRMGQVPDRDSEPDTVRLVPYSGNVWCITVPSGAFVARRNGVVFVTGNSGFPKSKASLKPAWEPIVMARKPGPLRMLAIDACRIPSEDGTETARGRYPVADDAPAGMGKGLEMGGNGSPLGRWPANVVLSDPIFDGGIEGVVGGGETVLGGGTGRGMARASAFGFGAGPGGSHDDPECIGDYDPEKYGMTERCGANNCTCRCHRVGAPTSLGDSGTYSRFFLIPKADRGDREPVLGGLTGLQPGKLDNMGDWPNDAPSKSGGVNRRNVHPTVKPVDLMRHLVRLVTPTGGVVLDPFGGSGTTALAAEMEGFDWILIEREAEYVAIAEARLNGTQRGLGLEVPAPTPKPRHASIENTTAKRASYGRKPHEGTTWRLHGHEPIPEDEPA